MGELLHDGEPQAKTTGGGIARAFKAMKWPEHSVKLVRRNTRTPVEHTNPHTARRAGFHGRQSSPNQFDRAWRITQRIAD
jgi:hypothetical protein